MIMYDAMKIRYQVANFLGRKVLFTDIRIASSSLPVGIYKYDIRHDDDGQGTPCTVENSVYANYYGSILTKEPIKFSIDNHDDRYLDINRDDKYYQIDYTGEFMYLEDFMKETDKTANN